MSAPRPIPYLVGTQGYIHSTPSPQIYKNTDNPATKTKYSYSNLPDKFPPKRYF